MKSITRRNFVKTGLLWTAAAGILTPRRLWAADAVPSSYRPVQGDWVNYCGVRGGIPEYVQTGATIAAYSGDASAIETAFNNAPDGTFVKLGPGTFTIGDPDGIILEKSRVELRGTVDSNGVPLTELNFTFGGTMIHMREDPWDLTNAGQFNVINITSPAPEAMRGTTTVTLASTPSSLDVGQIMFITSDQNFFGNQTSADFLGNEWSQIVRVVSKSGNDVTFSPAINADFLSGGTMSVAWRAQTLTTKRSGIRNLLLTGGTGHYVRFSGCDECWAVNIVTNTVPSGTYHYQIYGCYRTEIRHCDSQIMVGNSNSAYVISPTQTSQNLIIDNYFHNVPNVMPMFGMNGSAFAYNYCNDFPYEVADTLSQIVFCHGALSHYNLFEGNWYPSNHNDSANNTSSRSMVYLRNRMLGWDATPTPTGKTANTKPFAITNRHVNMAIVGNVLGKDGHQNAYETTSDEFAGNVMYYVQAGGSGLVRKGNYNTVSDAIPASEAIGGDTIADSYLFSMQQTFMKRFPLVRPDDYSGSNDVTNLLAAGYRASNAGVDPDWLGPILGKPISIRGVRLKL